MVKTTIDKRCLSVGRWIATNMDTGTTEIVVRFGDIERRRRRDKFVAKHAKLCAKAYVSGICPQKPQLIPVPTMITTRISITANSHDDTAAFLKQLIIVLEQTDIDHAEGADSEGQSFSFDSVQSDDHKVVHLNKEMEEKLKLKDDEIDLDRDLDVE